MLLVNVKGPTSFVNLRTVEGVEWQTYREACQKLHLLETDQHWEKTLTGASASCHPRQIRTLFAIILTTCSPSNPKDLWEKFREDFSEDILHRVRTISNDNSIKFSDNIFNQALIEIEDICLTINNKALTQLGMIAPQRSELNLYDSELLREQEYNANDLRAFVEANEQILIEEQKLVYDTIKKAVSKGIGGLFFLDAPGGTGKTFLIILLLAHIRSQNGIALALASSGIAATLFDGGRTAHSALKLPLDMHFSEAPTCNISKGSGMAKVLQICKLIVWDECTMAHKKSLEALDRTMKDLRSNAQPFGGALILLSGDFRQTLPVIPKSTPADELNASIKASHLWRHVRKLTLTTNMRVHLQRDPTASTFPKNLLDIGEGKLPVDAVTNSISLPLNFCVIVPSVEQLVHKVFPKIFINYKNHKWLSERAILAAKNTDVNAINHTIQEQIPGDSVTYKSIDSVIKVVNYPLEFLNSLDLPGVPQHKLSLKVGVPIILLRNINPPRLCNGTRLAVKKLMQNVIEATILNGKSKGEDVLIPRTPIIPTDMPFDFKRIQFPIRLAFSMTINKAQGQSLKTEDEDSDYGAGNIPDDKLTFLRDGRRKVDFVLVYEVQQSAGRRGSVPTQQANAVQDKKLLKHEQWRQKFMENLGKAGLEMEEEVVQSASRKLVYFVKIHATWPTLCHYAEELNMRAPLQAHPNPSMNWSETALKMLRLPNIMFQDVPCKPLDFYTCPFRKSKISRFLGSENRDTFFSNTQRSRIVYEILSTTMFGKKKKGELGVDRMVDEGVFSSSFPLHDGSYESKTTSRTSPMNPRQVLYQYWARWGCWYKYQPLDHIREYFGEKIAIYFAWLGFYTGWLLPIAIVGLFVFLYGVFTMRNNRLAIEVCENPGAFKMCPLCDENIGCKYWDLSDICGYAKLAYLFDHPGTVFYAVFVSFWAVTFLEYWKRKSASLAHHWDCMGFQDEIERPRPEFAAKAPFLQRNPVTGVQEPAFPRSLRNKRVAAGLGIVFLMISLVLIFIVAVIIYRVLVSIPLFQNATFRSQAQAIANMSGAVVNLFIIMAMSRIYENLAYRLTSWEMHRTQTEFDDNLTFKVFIFQFVNYYSSIFYIAFFKGRFVGYPGKYTLILNLRNEDCNAGGCLIELAQQLAVIMIGKQIINNAQEIIVPKLKAWWHNKKVKLPKKRRTRWEEDYGLVDYEGLFEEYLEMVLQFGFITIFVAAFPLAPLFALLNNWVEIRLDAQKFVCETRRIVAERAENIGIWFKILNMLAHLAVISNGFLIAFTSEFLPKLLYQYDYDWNLKGYINFTLAYSPPGKLKQQCRYRGLRDENGNHTPFFWRLLAIQFAFVIIFEHVVFGICRLIDILVPDIPESLELKIKRERYLAKQALQDSDTIMKVAAGVEDFEERDRRMVLDLTAELGREKEKSPQAADHPKRSPDHPKRSPDHPKRSPEPPQRSPDPPPRSPDPPQPPDPPPRNVPPRNPPPPVPPRRLPSKSVTTQEINKRTALDRPNTS